MDWVPHTIDALTRMGAEFGIFGLCCVVFLLFVMLVAWRHSNAILTAIQTFLAHKGEEIGELKTQNAKLENLITMTAETNRILGSWGSDPPCKLTDQAIACKAKELDLSIQEFKDDLQRVQDLQASAKQDKVATA